MKRALGAILFVVYSIIAIIVTVLLLSFNDYNCSVIGGYTVYIVKDDALEPEYKEGSILLMKETSDKHVEVGDEIFLYQVINSQEYELVSRTLQQKHQQGRHIVYEVENEENYDNSYFVGKAEDTIVINAPLGTILGILESKWGYLFCIVVVSLLLFLQEVFDLVIEIKYGGTKGTKAANVAHARKTGAKATGTTRTATAKTAAAKTTTGARTATKTATKTSTASTVAKTVATAAKVNNTNINAETGEKEG